MQGLDERIKVYDRFPFLDIPKPKLNEIMKPFIRQAAKSQDVDWNFIFLYWEKEYREAQYMGWNTYIWFKRSSLTMI
jgi:hypothetical protein